MSISDLLSILDAGDVTLDASFRSVPFQIIDSRDPPGRRLIRFMFPGIDNPAFQDLGQDDGEISISGLLIGDDYIQQAQTLRTAFQTPGPATLVHPWLGNLLVLLTGKPEISFTHDELRVARFTCVVARFTARQPVQVDTQASLLDQLNSLRQTAFSYLQQGLSLVSRVLSVVSTVRNFAASVAGFFNLAIADVSGITSELFGPAMAPAIVALQNNISVPLDDTFGANIGALLAGPSAAALAAAEPPIPAAVAPGGSTATAASADPRIAASMLLNVAGMIAALPAMATPLPGLMLATQALVVADAIATASDIVYTSQQDAAGWLTQLQGQLDTLISAAMVQGATDPVTAGNIWRAAIASRSALSIDMNAQIGRLPAVVSFTPPQAVPVWLLAQYLSGDTPGQVFATYLDLVSRNSIENPALVPPGPIETLVQPAALSQQTAS